MFELTKEEYDSLRRRFGTLKRGEPYMGKGRRGNRDNVRGSGTEGHAISARTLYSKPSSNYTPKGSKKKIYYRLEKKQPPDSIGLPQTQTHN
jgi:hypothetical protein